MKSIWYLLKCPEGNESYYAKKCREFFDLIEMEEAVCFRYQRMMRYNGKWHLEVRILLPGHIFVSGTRAMIFQENNRRREETEGEISTSVFITPCEMPYMKKMCQEGDVIGMSKGVIRNGNPIVISGPLKGRESLIRKIDRHKRIAEIEIPFAGVKRRVMVGLEIYEKQI